MPQYARTIRTLPRIARLLTVLAMLDLAGCATVPPEPLPEESPPPEVLAEATIPIIEAPPEPPPTVEIPIIRETPPPAIAIVFATREPAYEDVVLELEKHFDAFSIYDLGDKSQPPDAAFRLINDSDTAAVVAVGLSAAISAVQLSNVPVIFSQVFNHQDHDLITESSRGIAATAPLDAQISAWKELDPTVSEIGIIIGEGHEALLAEAELAAERHSVRLNIVMANSDQETLFLFKRMVQDIDGFWLFPDNRILSARVLREILQDAKRRDVTVVVPNDSMLPLGAAISITTVPSDIAEKIAEVVHQVQANRFSEVPSVTPLTAIRVTTSEDFARKRVVAGSPETPEGARQ